MSSGIWTIAKRELLTYLTTPIGVMFLVIFLSLTGALTFYVGGFYEREIADLDPFFQFHPWVYLFVVPALGMRLWSEEFKSGSSELLLTMPITTWQAVIGKYLATWMLIGFALSLTFPIWVSVNVLGSPDNGVIVAGYLASWLVAGAFLAMSSLASALTDNQVVAFVLACLTCFVFLMFGMPLVLEPLGMIFPEALVDLIAQAGILMHYQSMANGVLAASNIVYFLGLIGACLFGNWLVIELRRAA